MNAERVARGLQIFLKYDAEAECFAELDILYATISRKIAKEIEISKEDLRVLKDLGWHFDKDYDCWAKHT